MNFFQRFFCSFDHEDFTNHKWGKWEQTILNVKRISPLTGFVMEGLQDAQKRKCEICGKTEVEDIEL